MSDESVQATDQEQQTPPEPTEADVLKVLETGTVPGEEKPEATEETPKEETQEQKPDESFEANARLERQNRELREKTKQLEELQEAAKDGPLKALEKLGLDPFDLLQEMEPGEDKEPVEEVKSEVTKLKEELEQQKKALEHSRLEMYVNERKKLLLTEAQQAAEEYPFAKMAIDSDSSFLDTMMQYAAHLHQETGKVPGDQDLLKAADEFVLNDFMARLNDFTKTPAGVEKIQSHLSKHYTGDADTDKPPSDRPRDTPKTLTNEMSSDASIQKAPEGLSDEEAEKEFLRAMKEKGWVGD